MASEETPLINPPNSPQMVYLYINQQLIARNRLSEDANHVVARGSVSRPDPEDYVLPPTPPSSFGSYEQMMSCPHCYYHGLSSIKFRPNENSGWWTYAMFIICCPCMLFTGYWRQFKLAHHYCGKCKAFLGIQNR